MAAVLHPLFETPLPANWRLLKVDDIKSPERSACVAGPFGSNISSKFFVESGVPIIRGGNLRDDLTRFVPENFAFVSEEQATKYKAQHVRAGDLVFTCWGTVGQVGLIPPNGPFPEYIISNKQLKLRANPEMADPVYLFFYFAGPKMVQHVLGKAIGAAVPGINLGILKELPVVLPPLPVQRRIAGILSAYDELIENSQRRIRILESMARALYREWFVHYRYPGHEKVPRVASPLGEIPRGWEVRKLAEFVTTKYGYTESTNAEPVGPKYLRGMDINKNSFIDWSEVPYCPITPEEHRAYRLQVGDVMVIRMADPGKVGIVEQEVDAVFASYLIRVAPKDSRLSPYFLFYLLESAEYYAYITGASTGTTRKSASAGVIVDYQFVMPPQELVEQFEGRVSEIRSLLTTLLEKTVNLRRTRDLLLPRLLSGQVELGELEKAG